MYDFLSTTQVPAHAAGEPSALYRPSPLSGYPVLGHDPLTGELTQVRWNNDDRSVMNNLQPELVEEWYVVGFLCSRSTAEYCVGRYKAIGIWNQCLTSSDSEFWVQLQPGTAVGTSSYL